MPTLENEFLACQREKKDPSNVNSGTDGRNFEIVSLIDQPPSDGTRFEEGRDEGVARSGSNVLNAAGGNVAECQGGSSDQR
mmetsp:Transcript_10884/g.32227  ORF Transcript_10884/g.32227 Transcript_10884/m.32227 type:complete len:81 (-) Transcript_10884:239-481(-)|eukprot:CAMPEP_0113565836 /NCGR_PEP_ID=MMETSP0015_2-20120614/22396_1 /TAXON_ID=2838 /ORGANISM="Odontella" /LENGTH=80 /DNA_ID=CAMNT_0000468073 /DNA_START=238 /DNA_END=480 /DNA_ORIENTATION=+ /assembly_acc=CAM_ASM_000160